MSFELFYVYASDRSYGLDWIGFRKLDPLPTLTSLYVLVVVVFIIFIKSCFA